MAWSITQSPALQAPIALSPVPAALAIIGQPGGPQGQVGKTPPQSVIALSGSQPVLSAGINAGAGAASLSGSAPQRWQGPLRIPSTVAAVLSGSAPSVVGGGPATNPLGINVCQPAYYNPEQAFINLMKTANLGSGLTQPWMTQNSAHPGTDTGEEGYLQVDADGYPTSLVASPTPSGGQQFNQVAVWLNTYQSAPGAVNFYPAGTYRLKFIGKGTVSVGFDGSATLTNSSSNTYVSQTFTVTPSGNGLYVTISSLPNSGDYIRDISIVYQPNAAAYDAGAIFNPDFLSALAKFKSVRLMDWQRTNDELFGFTVAGVINAGATSLTLSSPWQSPSSTRSIYFIDGEVRQGTFTVGSTEVTWSGGLANTISSTTWGSQNNFATFWISNKESWATRTLPSNCSWAMPGGVPLEVCIALANALSANAHLNVPISASDSYVTSFAQLVLNGTGAATGYGALNSFLNASFELSNETWNGVFAQYGFCGAAGAALWPTQPSGGGNYEWNRNYFGMRTAQMAATLQSVYGSNFGRCIPILGAQAASTDTASRALAAAYWTTGSGPPSIFPIKNIAIAPYYPSSTTTAADCATMLAVATPLDDLFACMTGQTGTAANGSKVYSSVPSNGWLGQIQGFINSFIALMPSYPGMSLIAYEGGQNFIPTSSGTAPGWPALLTSAERDARMGASYTSYLNYWKANVGASVFNINHLWVDVSAISASGAFGLAENLEQLVAGGTVPPKWAAAQSYITGTGGAAVPGISIRGNQFFNVAYGSSGGSAIQLRGANMSALEFVGVQGFNNVNQWGGVIPAWNVYKTWKPNCVRIPLNAASWLGLTCQTAHGQPATAFSGTNVKADPQSNYIATVDAGIAAAQAIGCYVILDLHWCAPQVTLGGVTQYILPDGQPMFPDASTGIPFWTSIAARYGSAAIPQPGINNNAIMFELFNEPYLRDNGFSGASLNSLMKSGGNVSKFAWAINAYNVQPSGGVNIAGYQQMLNAIRANGSTNICIVNGDNFTQDLSYFTSIVPTDSLATKQIAAGWHPYPDGTYPYSNGDVYGKVGGDPGAGTVNFDQSAKAVLAAGYPLIITEDGGRGGTSATASPAEPHMAFMQNWADTHGASYVWWQWNNPQSTSTTSTDNYGTIGSLTAPTPILGEGSTTFAWMSAHP